MSETLSQTQLKQKKQNRFWAILAFAGVLIVLALIGIRLINQDATPVEMGESPADFSLTTFEGEVIHSADLRGKVVLINFWASWCSTCVVEATLLEQAWQHYQTGDQSDRVIFLGVAYMDIENAAGVFLGDHDVTFPNGLDLRGSISRIYQVSSVPETFILDAEGVLRDSKIGPFSSVEEILTAVDGALSQPVD